MSRGTGERGGREAGRVYVDPETRTRLIEALLATLSDEGFVATPGTVDLLVYLVKETVAGDAGRLDAAHVLIEGLGRPPVADPDSDPALWVILRRLRRLLEERRARVEPGQDVLRLSEGAYAVVVEQVGGPVGDGPPDTVPSG